MKHLDPLLKVAIVVFCILALYSAYKDKLLMSLFCLLCAVIIILTTGWDHD